MRWRVVVGAMLAVLVVAELVAAPVAARLASRGLARCLPHESLAIVAVRRPALVELAVGRVRDVELVVGGASAGPLRIEEARLRADAWSLPWGRTAAPGWVDVALEVTEADLAAAAAAYGRFGIRPQLELRPDVVEVGAAPLPLRVRLRVEVTDDAVRLVPAGGAPGWWQRLALTHEVELPPTVEVTTIDVGADQVHAAGRLAVDAPLAVGGDCAWP